MPRVVRASPGDLGVVLDLFREGCAEAGVRLSDDAPGCLAWGLSMPGMAGFLAVEEDGRVAGGCLMAVDPLFVPSFGQVVKFYVRPPWRGTAVARLLLLAGEDWCWRQGASRVLMHGHFPGEVPGYVALARAAGYKPGMSVFVKERG